MTKPVAIGDPVESIFRLSEDVAQAAPRLRRDFWWGVVISLFFLGVLAAVVVIFVVTALRAPLDEVPAIGIAVLFTLAFCYAAFRALLGARRGAALLDEFLRRHRAILAVRDMNPIVHVPQGQNHLSRYEQYLRNEDPKVWDILSRNPLAYHAPLTVQSAPDNTVNFDIGIVDPGSWSYRLFGLGRPGWSLLVREIPGIPTLADIDQIEKDAIAASEKLGAHPERLVILSKDVGALSDSVYERVVGPPRLVRRGLICRPFVTSVVMESPDRTYDFTPHIVDIG